MKQLLLATAATALLAGGALAEDVKLGILIGFTGPIESLTPAMQAAAELAMTEANASGKAANGWTFVPVTADSPASTPPPPPRRANVWSRPKA
jgi:branched-chain amino acid transport system substrate-binding protein